MKINQKLFIWETGDKVIQRVPAIVFSNSNGKLELISASFPGAPREPILSYTIPINTPITNGYIRINRTRNPPKKLQPNDKGYNERFEILGGGI